MIKIIGIEQFERIVEYKVISSNRLINGSILKEIAKELCMHPILQNETQIHARVDYVLQKHNLLRKESSSKVTHICLGANNIVKELEVFVDLGRNRFKGGNDVM